MYVCACVGVFAYKILLIAPPSQIQGAVHGARGVLGAADVVELANAFELGDWVRVVYVPHPPNTLDTLKGDRSVQVTNVCERSGQAEGTQI